MLDVNTCDFDFPTFLWAKHLTTLCFSFLAYPMGGGFKAANYSKN